MTLARWILASAVGTCALCSQIPFFDPSIIPAEVFSRSNGAIPGTGVGSCNQTLLNSCSATYFQAFGLPPLTPSTTTFLAALRTRMSTKKGYLGVCMTNTAFYQCLGGPGPSAACLNPLALMASGLGPSEAFTWASIRGNMDFQCGPGLMPVLVNWACISSTAMKPSVNSTLQGCAADFHRHLTSNFGQACTYVQQFVNCYTTAFSTCNAASGWALCEQVRVGTVAANLYQCDAKTACQITPSHMSEQSEVETGIEAAMKVHRSLRKSEAPAVPPKPLAQDEIRA